MLIEHKALIFVKRQAVTINMGICKRPEVFCTACAEILLSHMLVKLTPRIARARRS